MCLVPVGQLVVILAPSKVEAASAAAARAAGDDEKDSRMLCSGLIYLAAEATATACRLFSNPGSLSQDETARKQRKRKEALGA